MMPQIWTNLSAFLLLLFFIGHTNSTFQLDAFKSHKLIQLFLNRTLTIQLDIGQRNQTKFELFTINQVGRRFFQFSSSTIENNILIEFRLKDGRWKRLKIPCPFLYANDQFHKIIFALDGRKITVAENCRQLFQGMDNELEFGQYPANQLSIHLGPNKGGQNDGLQIREFSAFQHQIENICPQMEMLIDNRIQAEYLANEIGGSGQQSAGKQNELEKNEVTIGEEDEGEKELGERIDFLEGQITHWSQLFAKFEGRMKRIELHQRGCVDSSGKLMSPGQKIQNISECTECQCGLDSALHCKPIGCPRLAGCTHPVYEEGNCCPKCGKKCLHNGKYYESGEEFWPKQCTFCLCKDGRMECGFRFTNACPILDCPQKETLPNQCCPVCVNVDHCAPRRNPCSPNATCHSARHSAICRCKEGFFGNGTICADVDECLWDRDARKQLGGCGDGTICINMPGSFKCECLPGYQKLDDRNCLDVIRI